MAWIRLNGNSPECSRQVGMVTVSTEDTWERENRKLKYSHGHDTLTNGIEVNVGMSQCFFL